MLLLFYFFAAIVIWLGILSLLGGIRFSRYVNAEMLKPLNGFQPFVSIIAPTRGLDQGLKENISSLLRQRYPHFEIIFVTDQANDVSLEVIKSAITENNSGGKMPVRMVVAGEAIDSGQKVHNLRAAVAELDQRSEVIVFVDTDARPSVDWLQHLVDPLIDERIGAASGYRWFIPVRGGISSHLRSVWNSSIVSALGQRNDKNFCWGGSTAIRVSTFEELEIRERWRGSVSDDFTLTNALQQAKRPIHFVPACLVPSLEDCNASELLEFTNRQLKITRVYAPHLWIPLLIGSLLFTAVFFGGLLLVITRAALGLSYAAPLVLLLLIYFLGTAKAIIRLRAAMLPLANYRLKLRQTLPAHVLLWPFASALYLWNAMVAGFSRRIEWRGITYELKSATEAVIIRPT